MLNLFSENPTKWSKTLKQFVGYCRRIVWVFLTILWGFLLKGLIFLCSYRLQLLLKKCLIFLLVFIVLSTIICITLIWCIISKPQDVVKMLWNFGKSEPKCSYKLGSYKSTLCIHSLISRVFARVLAFI